MEEQPVAATHQSTSIENLAHDLGQLNLSGGATNMSLSDLLLSILKTTKENSDQIKENLDQIKENWDQIKENWDQIKENSDQINSLIQIEQARNREPVLGKYELEGYLCELMPDLSFFRKEDAVDDAYIPMLVQTILELKAQKTSTGFSNEEKGQLLDYIHILVRQQPLRKLFAIFLSNGSYFYVMSYDRDTNEYQQYETTFSNGLRLLHTLVSRNSDFIKAIGTRGVNFRSKISSTCDQMA
ncbi:unnamed protein product [Rhizophagus irregularis]|nr:unnamed protein product [Rhizophagus irregularis]